jgi:hypothetical protein
MPPRLAKISHIRSAMTTGHPHQISIMPFRTLGSTLTRRNAAIPAGSDHGGDWAF